MTAAAVLCCAKSARMMRPYRTLGYPLVPLLFVLELDSFIFYAIDRPRESVNGNRPDSLGLPFYFYWKKRRNRAIIAWSNTYLLAQTVHLVGYKWHLNCILLLENKRIREKIECILES